MANFIFQGIEPLCNHPICWHRVDIICLYYHFNIYGIYSYILLCFHFWHKSFVFFHFFLIIIYRGINFIDIFIEETFVFFFFTFSYYFFILNFIEFCCLFYFSSLYFELNLLFFFFFFLLSYGGNLDYWLWIFFCNIHINFINFPLGKIAFSHTKKKVVFLFSFISKYFKNFLKFLLWLVIFSGMLFNLHIVWDFI